MLPRTRDVWGVAVRDIGARVQGEPLHVALILDSGGFAVSAAPLEDPRDVGHAVAEAMRKPAVGPPRRPSMVNCPSHQLRSRVAKGVKGSGVQVVVGDLPPGMDAAFASLEAELAGPTGCGITILEGRFRRVLRRFADLAPWRFLGEETTFQFLHGADLDGAIGMVIGEIGESRGLVVFPSAEHHTRMHLLADFPTPPPDLIAELESLTINIEPLDEVPPAVLADATERDLLLPGPFVPMLLHLRDGEMTLPDEREQVRLLAALEAVLGTLDEWDFPAPGSHVESLVETVSEPVHIAMSVEADGDALVTCPHALLVGQMGLEGKPTRPALVIKAAKRDATRLSRELAHIDALSVRQIRNGSQIWGLLDGEEVGTIGWLEGDAIPWRTGDEVVLAISAGGSKRLKLRPRDLVSVRVLPVEDW
jgi:hypothetical protein